MAFTNYTAQALLNSLHQKTSNFGALATPPGGAGGMWAALATAVADGEAGSFTEATGTGYARVQVAPADWNAATLADPSLIDNANPIAFPQAGGDWSGGANMTHVFLMDASTGGNAIEWGALTTPKPVLSGDTFSFAAGDLDITLD